MNRGTRISMVAWSIALACVGRQHVDSSISAEQTPSASPPAPAPAPWESLLALELDFVPPEPLSPADIPIPPTELPPARDGDVLQVEDVPVLYWPNLDLPCGLYTTVPYITVPYCSHRRWDHRGDLVRESRIAYVGDQVELTAEFSERRTELRRCWYDAAGRIIKRQKQKGEYWNPGCPVWDVSTTRIGYDELGGPVFVEEVDEIHFPGSGSRPGDSLMTIFYPVYENGLPIHLDVIETNLGFDYTDIVEISNFEWEDGRLVRTDNFGSDGAWEASRVLTWSENVLRVDRFEPDREGSTVIIYERRGPADYVRRYPRSETHWEYAIEDGVKTSSKFVGELLVERRRFAVVGDDRRPLSIERLVPDVLGLVVVERWDWSQPDRGVVERQDGSREEYLLDCSQLPPIDSLVDPDCPPPKPLR